MVARGRLCGFILRDAGADAGADGGGGGGGGGGHMSRAGRVITGQGP